MAGRDACPTRKTGPIARLSLDVQPAEDEIGVAEIINRKVGAGGAKVVGCKRPRCDGERAAGVRLGAPDIVNRVADDRDLVRGDVDSASLPIPSHGDRGQMFTERLFMRRVAPPDADRELLDGESGGGEFGGAGFGEVAREEAQCDVPERVQGLKEFDDAGKRTREAGGGESLDEPASVGRSKRLHGVGAVRLVVRREEASHQDGVKPAGVVNDVFPKRRAEKLAPCIADGQHPRALGGEKRGVDIEEYEHAGVSQ